MNSDHLAKGIAFGLVAVKAVLSWELMSDAHWTLYLLWVPLFWILYKGLMPIADAVTGKSYIKSMHNHREVKIYRNQPIQYCVELGFSLFLIMAVLYMMFWFIP